MKLTVNDLKIEIDLYDLFSELPREEQLALAHHLAIEDEIIKQVVSLLVDGHTENGSWTGHCSGDVEEKARVTIVEKRQDVAAQLLKDVMHDRNVSKAEHQIMSDWAWKLFHSWPDHAWHQRPSLESASAQEWAKRYVSLDEAKKLLDSQK